MQVIIKLKLARDKANLPSVRSLPGMQGISLDPAYGVVCISPREGLYVVRADSVDDIEERQALSAEMLGVYGDVRITQT